MYSIKRFLLINLLIGVTIIIGLSIMANIANEHSDFKLHLDAQLAMSAYTIESFLDETSNHQDLQLIQQKINAIDRFRKRNIENNNVVNSLMRSVHFQIWNEKNELILRSYNFPALTEPPHKLGFMQIQQNNLSWQSLTIKTKQHFTIQVMQLNSFRLMVERQLTNDSILVLLVMYPALGMLIWVIVGKGMVPINRITNNVRKRKPQQLSPIKIKPLPEEIQPLINALNQLFNNLNQTLHREQRFASNAAHELKTPMAALKARVQLAQKQSGEDLKNSLMQLIIIVDRCTHIINQLLILSKMNPDNALKKPEPVNLINACKTVIQELEIMSKPKDIQVKLSAKLMKNTPNIMSNVHYIHILIRNLVDNAIRYSPPGTQVDIRLYQEQQNIVLEVQDQGPGLNEKHKKRVFERFFRVFGSNESGSGLGLSIVKEIAQLNKAKIYIVNPKSGQGLIIRVIFNVK
jgi:two-component system sensor histidine kinase QseC